MASSNAIRTLSALFTAALVWSGTATVKAESTEGRISISTVVQTKCAVVEGASNTLDVSCSEAAPSRITTSPVQTISANGYTQRVIVSTVNF